MAKTIYTARGNCPTCIRDFTACNGDCKPTPEFVRRAADKHAQAIGDAIAEEFDMPLMTVHTDDKDARFVCITALEHLRLLAIEECAQTLLRDRVSIELHFQDLRNCLKTPPAPAEPAPEPAQEKPA